MVGRESLTILTSIALVILLTGCPPQGNSVAGAWNLRLDDGCDASIDREIGLILDSDGVARLYFNAFLIGTWSVNNNAITITFSTGTLSGIVASNGATMTNGVGTGGCWTAERIAL